MPTLKPYTFAIRTSKSAIQKLQKSMSLTTLKIKNENTTMCIVHSTLRDATTPYTERCQQAKKIIVTEINVREKYRELINDIDFDKLELQLKTPNIFQILGVARTEIRHSNFLGWLLDPNGNHGLGKLFLTKFLRGISTSDVATELDEFEIEELNFNNVEIRREWKNIDLLLIFDSLVICIENKIDSKDHSNQLTKYREIVNSNFKSKKKVFVYLTPIGELPTDQTEREYYATYSYQEIIEQSDRILKIHGNSLNNGVNQYISDYLTTIKRELMKNDELNELADKIYKN